MATSDAAARVTYVTAYQRQTGPLKQQANGETGGEKVCKDVFRVVLCACVWMTVSVRVCVRTAVCRAAVGLSRPPTLRPPARSDPLNSLPPPTQLQRYKQTDEMSQVRTIHSKQQKREQSKRTEIVQHVEASFGFGVAQQVTQRTQRDGTQRNETDLNTKQQSQKENRHERYTEQAANRNKTEKRRVFVHGSS